MKEVNVNKLLRVYTYNLINKKTSISNALFMMYTRDG